MKKPAAVLTAVLLFVVSYLLSPLFFWLRLMYELEAGAFPVDADAIAIPMAGYLVLWLAVLPLIVYTGAVILKELRYELEDK